MDIHLKRVSLVGAIWVFIKVLLNDGPKRLDLFTLHLESLLDDSIPQATFKVNLQHQSTLRLSGAQFLQEPATILQKKKQMVNYDDL